MEAYFDCFGFFWSVKCFFSFHMEIAAHGGIFSNQANVYTVVDEGDDGARCVGEGLPCSQGFGEAIFKHRVSCLESVISYSLSCSS